MPTLPIPIMNAGNNKLVANSYQNRWHVSKSCHHVYQLSACIFIIMQAWWD